MPEWILTTWDNKVIYLLVLALFFAMLLCKYLTTRYLKESKKGNILISGNIKSRKDRNIVSNRAKLNTLISTTIIIIIYEFYNNAYRDKL